MRKGPTYLLILASYAPSLVLFRGPLIRDLKSAGHRVSVCAPDISQDDLAKLRIMGAEVHDIPMQRTGLNPLADLSYQRRLGRLMAKLRPDKVMSYTIKPNIWGALAAAQNNIPSYAMVTGLGGLFTSAGGAMTLRQKLLRRLATSLYSRSTKLNRRVIFQNPDDLTDFRAAGCLSDFGKAALVDGSGVDMLHYHRAPLPRLPSFLMVSRLLKTKGVREYAEAAIALKSRNPQVRFRLVGYFDEGRDGIKPTDLNRWTAQGLEYSGPQSDIRPAMSEASVFVLPSYREGTPRSTLEAMAMGRPAITTDAPGCRETVKCGKNGFVVPVADAPALERAMARVIASPDMIAPMGDASYRLVRRRYEVGSVNRKMLALLDLTKISANQAN